MLRVVRVRGSSMAPTYLPSDLLLTGRPGRDGARVRRGDVVVLRRLGALVVKRVVAMAGDVVELEAGRLAVGGDPVPGAGPRVRGALVRRWVVPPGTVFVAGDNADASEDSRVWAEPYVPLADVVARVRRRAARRPVARRLLRRRPAPAAVPAT